MTGSTRDKPFIVPYEPKPMVLDIIRELNSVLEANGIKVKSTVVIGLEVNKPAAADAKTAASPDLARK